MQIEQDIKSTFFRIQFSSLFDHSSMRIVARHDEKFLRVFIFNKLLKMLWMKKLTTFNVVKNMDSDNNQSIACLSSLSTSQMHNFK